MVLLAQMWLKPCSEPALHPIHWLVGASGAVPITWLERSSGRRRIRSAIDKPPDAAPVIRSIAEIMAISQPFTIFHLNQPGNPCHTDSNVRNILMVLQNEIARRTQV